MISNYIKITIRNFKRYWSQSIINLLGLSIGFLCIILIGLYIDHEAKYDQFHSAYKNIFRLTDPWFNQNGYTRPAIVPPLWAEAIANEFPEIESYTRIDKMLRFNPLVANGEVKFFEDGFIGVDSTFFTLFDFKLKSGDVRTALRENNSIILTESKALKYFGNEPALGKILVLDNNRTMRVSAVLEDLPNQSHLEFNFMIPINNTNEFNWVYSFFKLKPKTDLSGLERKLAPLLKARFQEKYSRQKYEPKFQALASIHLNSNLDYEFKNNGNAGYLYLLGSIGMIILIVSSFNYVNLGIVLASMRAKEFGVRKTFGGEKKQFRLQAMVEATVLSSLAFLLALGLSYLVYPKFSDLLDKSFDWSGFIQNYFMMGIGLTLLIALASGAYPAILLSSLKPVEALSGKFSSKSSGSLRKSLVTVQFIISLILISSAIVIYQQLNLFKNKDLGFDREQVIIVNARTSGGLGDYLEPLKNKLESLSGVELVSFSQTVPGDYSNMANMGYRFQGAEDDRVSARTISVSQGFIGTLGIDLVAGRDFSSQIGTDTVAYIINEACVKMLGWNDAIGKRMELFNIRQMGGEVIGVMKDFHFASLHNKIEPLVFVVFPRGFQKVLIRTNPSSNNLASTLNEISMIWKEVLPEYPFEFEFMDQKFAALYEADEQFSRVFVIFTIVAILLTCFGLYGMVAFDVRKRLKEIGIRRVVGASVGDVVLVLNRNVLMLLLVGTFISIPISWYMIDKWLSNFAYAVSIRWWIFPTSFLVLLIVVFVTVGYRILTASRTNPVDILKHD